MSEPNREAELAEAQKLYDEYVTFGKYTNVDPILSFEEWLKESSEELKQNVNVIPVCECGKVDPKENHECLNQGQREEREHRGY